MNKATIATGGAFGASLLSALAASCCLAPALLVAFGLSAPLATPLTYLEPYRPYFTAVGALCLTTAGWWLYRRPTVCATGACVPPTQRPTRLFFWLGVAGFLAATFYPYLVTS
jgi:mercuric ion transport protein